MSEKKSSDYLKLIAHVDITASEFVMIGNSLKSDVLPVLEMGGYGIHVPFHTTWLHEQIDHELIHPHFFSAPHLRDAVTMIRNLS